MRRNPKNTGRRNRKRNYASDVARTNSTLLSASSNYQPGTVILKTPGAIAPDRLVCSMLWLDETYYRTNNGSSYANWRIRTNGLYDPDPALATGGIPGFVELGAIYSYYRVHSWEYDWEVANQEAFPLAVITVPLPADPGANASNFQQLSMVPYAKKTLLSAKGGQDRARLRGKMSTEKLVGSEYARYITDYAGTNAAIPSTLVYQAFGVASTSTLTTAAGIYSSLRITFHVEWYKRVTLYS